MKKNLTMSHLFATLFTDPAPPIIDNPDGTKKADSGEATTIRPNHRTRQFYDYHANRLGISMQAMMSMTLEAVMASSVEPFSNDINLSLERFKLLFREHGIAPIYINKILDAYLNESGKKFPMGAVTNDEILLSVLDTEYLMALSDIFGVSIDWLDGRDLIPSKLLPIIHRDWSFSTKKKIITPVNSSVMRESHHINIVVPESGDPNMHEGFGNKANTLIPILSTTYSLGEGSKTFRFITHRVQGVIPWHNDDARIGLKALVEYCKRNSIDMSGLVHSHDVVASLMFGNLAIEALEKETPSYWSIDEYITHDKRKSDEDDLDVSDVLKRLSSSN